MKKKQTSKVYRVAIYYGRTPYYYWRTSSRMDRESVRKEAARLYKGKRVSVAATTLTPEEANKLNMRVLLAPEVKKPRPPSIVTMQRVLRYLDQLGLTVYGSAVDFDKERMQPGCMDYSLGDIRKLAALRSKFPEGIPKMDWFGDIEEKK